MKLARTLAATLLALAVAGHATSIVERRGAPHVVGSQIVDKDGVPLQMTGVSLFWHQWMGQYYNQSVVDTLVSSWQANVIRVAMGVGPGSGTYLTSPVPTMRAITPAIDAAITDGIYVIIDWHEQDAPLHLDQAKQFFAAMARKYGDLPNVIFEIWNEPYNATADYTWADIKAYAQAVIPEIRKYSTNLVVVGTEFYSSNLADPAADPIDPSVYGDVAYTYHFYTCTHSYSSQGSFGIPVFVTEWGTSASDGGSDGKTCLTVGQGKATPAATWYSKWLDPQKVSSCNWSINNKAESSAALSATADATGANWDSTGSLTTSGTWVRTMIRSHCTKDPAVCPYQGAFPVAPALPVPGTIPAASWLISGGVAREASSEAQGGQDLFSIDSTDSVSYAVNAATDDTLWFQARVASAKGGSIAVYLDGVFADSLFVYPTGGTQVWGWSYGSRRVPVAAGLHRLKFSFGGVGKDLMRLHRIEAVHRSPVDAAASGEVPLDQLFQPLKGMGLGPMADGAPAMLRHVYPSGSAIFQVTAPASQTLSVSVLAANLGSNPASVVVNKRVGLRSAPLDTLVFQPSGAGTFQTVVGSAMIPLDSGANNITLTFLGDSGVAVLDIAAVAFGGSIGVRAHSIERKEASIRRIGSLLRIEVPTALANAEVSLVTADGRIWSRSRAQDGVASLAMPSARRPYWVRIQGSQGGALAVPPGL